MTDPTIAAVAGTLRQVAEWGLSFDNGPARGELYDIARQVEALAVGDDLCCPLCEEVTCDEGCPLAAVRAQLDGVDQPEARIVARLTAELKRATLAGPTVRDQRGLVDLEDYSAGDDIYVHLTIEDVARIAAAEARR